MEYRAVLVDQVFPDVTMERSILAAAGAELIVAGPGDDPIGLAENADAVLTTYFPIDASAIARLRQCRIIARYGIGVDNIDLGAARDRGIIVTNVPDYSVEEVAVHTLLLMLALIRRLRASEAQALEAKWDVASLRPIRRISELSIGIVGMGKIGRKVAGLLRPMGARLIGYDPFAAGSPEGVEITSDLDELFRTADVVTLHLPLTDQTHHLVDAQRLDVFKPDAILVNTSRGGLVDTAALVAALRTHKIAGAALDVLEHEPDDATVLAGAPNLLLTPHMAYYSESSLAEAQQKAATQIAKVLSGDEPDYRVN